MDGFDPLNARYRINDIATHPDGSHARALRLVGHGARVLELGSASGAMTEALVAQGCRVVAVEVEPASAAFVAAHADRVIVADLDTVDLRVELPGECFDAVIAADVLEHLKDPHRVLSAVVPLLQPGGAVIISLPNVAHAAVRLALLGGEFPYADCGLLDRTHLHMYTLESARELIEACGLAISDVERVIAPLYEALIDVRPERLPAGVEEWVLAQPEALTYQFVFRCTASPSAGNAQPTGASDSPPRPDNGGRELLAFQARAMAQMDDAIQRLRLDNAALSSTVARLQSELQVAAGRTSAPERRTTMRFTSSLGRLLHRRRRRAR